MPRREITSSVLICIFTGMFFIACFVFINCISAMFNFACQSMLMLLSCCLCCLCNKLARH